MGRQRRARRGLAAGGSPRGRKCQGGLVRLTRRGKSEKVSVGGASGGRAATRGSRPKPRLAPRRPNPRVRGRGRWAGFLVGPAVPLLGVLPARLLLPAATGRRSGATGLCRAADSVVLVLLSECHRLLPERPRLPGGVAQGRPED